MARKPELPEDERALFREAMADVRPQQADRVEPWRPGRAPRPLPHHTDETTQTAPGDLSIETPEWFEHRRPGVQQRVYQDLQRGLIPPEDSLDLHGLRVREARVAFARFLDRALARGLRCVRIVHGKGRNSEGAQPVLKQKTWQWLLQHDAVLAIVSAPRWDGGTGAAYALLSRKAGRGSRPR